MERINKISLESFEIDYGGQLIKLPRIELLRSNYPIHIVGKNGCGKTSLILTLAGVIPEYISAKTKIILNIYFESCVCSFPANQSFISIIPHNWKHGILGFYPLEEVQLIKTNDYKWRDEVIKTLEIAYSGDTDPPFRHTDPPSKKVQFFKRTSSCLQYYFFFLNDSPLRSILIA